MTEWVSGNILIRPMCFAKRGDQVDGHKHNFDHTWILFKGAATVVAKLPNGERVVVKRVAPAHLLIKAEVEHEITADVDETEGWCVYSHRTPQGDVVQEYTGWPDAYGLKPLPDVVLPPKGPGAPNG